VGEDSLFVNGCPHCGYNPADVEAAMGEKFKAVPLKRSGVTTPNKIPAWLYPLAALLFLAVAAGVSYAILQI
jgi:hypothetical protein